MESRPSTQFVNHQFGRVRYIPAFDGIRALCIMAVMVFHVISTNHSWLENIAKRGWCGVDVFFVLSGFLITWVITSELDRTATINLRQFYIRRVMRLQPTFLSGLVAVTLLLWFFNHTKFVTVIQQWPYFLTYTYNFAVAFAVIPFSTYGQVWSLCIEEHFYLLWPWLVRRVSERRALWLALGGIAIGTIYRSVLYASLSWHHLEEPSLRTLDRIYYGTDTRIDTILVGCATILALRVSSLEFLWRKLASWRWFTTVAFLAALIAFGWSTGGGYKGGWRASTIGFTLIATSTATVLAAIVLQPQSLPARFLACRPLVFIGRISYGIYLFHDPLWNGIGRAMGLRFGQRGSLLQECVALTTVFFSSVLLAWLHFITVEKRCMEWRNHLDLRKLTLDWKSIVERIARPRLRPQS